MITLLGQPGAATADCLETNVPGIGSGAQDLVDWMTAHPGLVASELEDVTVGGLAATSLMIEASRIGPAPATRSNPSVPSRCSSDRKTGITGRSTLAPGGYMTLIDLGDGDTGRGGGRHRRRRGPRGVRGGRTRPIIETFEFPAR